jgi:RNA polymerase sigma-70 factor (ECF subfamily)
MTEEQTTIVVQRYLDELAGDTPTEPVIRALLDRSVRRLQLLCANLLHRSYPRLTRPPLNLQADELLGSVVERLLKALRAVHPQNVRQFFALANQHMRWELNDLARRLDEQPRAAELSDGQVPAPESSGSSLSPEGRRVLRSRSRSSFRSSTPLESFHHPAIHRTVRLVRENLSIKQHSIPAGGPPPVPRRP